MYGAPFFTGAFFAADDDAGVIGLAQGGLKGDSGELVVEEALVDEIKVRLVGSGSKVG